jgi:hypothetical protein
MTWCIASGVRRSFEGMSAVDEFHAQLDAQLGHCQKLLEAVTSHVRDWRKNGGRPFADLADVLVQTVFARSTRTYEAVVEHLGNRGFGEQASMLNRSLFEDMVDAHWISLHPDLAVERLREHHRYSNALRLDVAQRFPEYVPNSLPQLEPPMTEEERKRLAGRFGTYGEKSWTGRSLHARWQDIEHCWSDETAKRQARFFYSWIHRTNNETLHLSSYSLANLGSPKLIADGLHFKLGSTEHLLGPALFCAFWTYLQTVSLLFERFELNGWQELDAAVVQPALAEFVSTVRANGDGTDRRRRALNPDDGALGRRRAASYLRDDEGSASAASWSRAELPALARHTAAPPTAVASQRCRGQRSAGHEALRLRRPSGGLQ